MLSFGGSLDWENACGTETGLRASSQMFAWGTVSKDLQLGVM